MTQKFKVWFILSGRALVLLATVMGLLVAVTGGIALVRRGQVQAYAPINLMNGNTVPPIVVNAVETGNGLTENSLIAETSLNPSPANAIPFDGNTIPHTVQGGETLYWIAQQYNLTADQVAAANGISNTDMIYEGQQLRIPVSAVVEVAQNMSILPTAQATLTEVYVPPPPPAPIDSSVPTTVNGISVELFAALPNSMIQHIRNIYAIGQAIGRNPRAFSKLGDSTIENPHFLTRFDGGPYTLGNFTYLQPLMTYYAGSFGRESVAVRRGLHTWSVFDPMWATGVGCAGGENMLACELRLQNPSVLFIHLGSNDAGVPDSTERSLQQIVEYAITNGVIPILGTKADRHEGSNINNEIIRRLAATYNVPLWDFDLLAATLPGRGLAPDGTHMTSFFAHDWSSPVAFERGYGLMNITALMMLDRVWRAVAT